MALSKFLEDCSSDEKYKIADFPASSCIFIAKRIKDDTAVDINVATQ